MEKANTVYMSHSITTKLCSLLNVLNEATIQFDEIADGIKDKNLKRTVVSIAVESRQYASELTSQLHSMGVDDLEASEKFNCNELVKSMKRFANTTDDRKKIQEWNNSENFFIKAYRDVLNEYFPFPSLREMVSYQLNGIKLAFMKMKLLNDLLYR